MSQLSATTCGSREVTDFVRGYLVDLRHVLTLAGATVLGKKPEEGEFLDQSPESLEEQTICILIQTDLL